jgi:putative FmdB family regulatory protein
MPIYEYRCRECGHAFAELVRRADVPPPACPQCRAQDTEKLMSLIGGVHVGAARTSCPSGPTCATAAGGGCRSCPMAA